MHRPYAYRKAYKLFFPAFCMTNLIKPDSEGKDIASDSSLIGKASGLFKYDGPKQDIKDELPLICTDLNTPSQLELSLVEGMENIKGDSRLTTWAIEEGKKTGANYALQAILTGKTTVDELNSTAADYVADILNLIYKSFYGGEGPITACTVYEKDGEYIFR